ncbi:MULTISPECIES: M4 family metallopeptidase [Mammaliicoccus]|uniref:Neutral metalloproteinase n=2 Tax=Mammaliicoccus sciuri TaxID=1296 RepID=A0AB37HXW2_MAMSC|nr:MULTISPECIES: M4 family metallopeptidase [Mammaliicoccus]MBF9298388.1 peptidase M4 family protein [Staphylococcus schleiferi]MCD8799358.1 M4 family metallopeptidase [Mammaliicoccus sciuri]MCD8894549.1 M4 family metallopeptidase [Mammaliicoccus sciuri]MCD8912738.1 M4 family metallopeptidase [Mammaliicoccus sciuri]MCE4979336.1 peptidase M4 family protein [Mammaliicoccus sciuri]
MYRSKKILSVGFTSVMALTLGLSNVASAKESSPLDQKELKSIPKQEINTKAEAQEILSQLPGNPNIKKSYKQFEVANEFKDNLGYTHYTLKPKVDNYVVEDKEVKIHTNDNQELELVNGDVNTEKVTYTNKQSLSKDEAVNKAFESIGVSQNEVKNIKGQKVVNKDELVINAEKKKLVYNVEIIYLDPKPARWEIKIDAETGEVVSKKNKIEHIAGSGVGVNGDTKKPLNLTKISNGYGLQDETHSGTIHTYDAKNGTSSFSLMTDTDTNFNSKNQAAGVDAHFNAAKTYDYYLNTHNRDSYDGNGAEINSIVHFDRNYNNAFWNGQYMVYGDGDGKTFTSLSAADDVVAHELTHAVTEHSANLVYENQPGALNESMSDVFGYFVDPEDWLMGEDAYTPGKPGDGLRSLSNPEQYNQPAHMNNYQNLPNTEQGDYGGVHINSGIPNKAAYLTITKIGKEKSEDIYYRALTQYLSSNSSFLDAKFALKQAASDLYGANSTEVQQVVNAWNSVGVTG